MTVEVNRSLIGKEDISLGTGTFTRRAPSGNQETLTDLNADAIPLTTAVQGESYVGPALEAVDARVLGDFYLDMQRFGVQATADWEWEYAANSPYWYNIKKIHDLITDDQDSLNLEEQSVAPSTTADQIKVYNLGNDLYMRKESDGSIYLLTPSTAQDSMRLQQPVVSTSSWEYLYTAHDPRWMNLYLLQKLLLGTRTGFVATYKDTDEITFDGGTLEVNGRTKTWAGGDITFSVGADESRFVYVSGESTSDILTSSDFSSTTTAPTWDDDKKGWYNAAGTDRCVFLFTTTSGSQIRSFYSDGNIVQYDDAVIDGANLTPSNTYTDITLTVPAFDDLFALVYFRGDYIDAVASLEIRKNGSSNGFRVSTVVNNDYDSNVVVVPVDSSAKIEHAWNGATTNRVNVDTLGYFIPRGM